MTWNYMKDNEQCLSMQHSLQKGTFDSFLLCWIKAALRLNDTEMMGHYSHHPAAKKQRQRDNQCLYLQHLPILSSLFFPRGNKIIGSCFRIVLSHDGNIRWSLVKHNTPFPSELRTVHISTISATLDKLRQMKANLANHMLIQANDKPKHPPANSENSKCSVKAIWTISLPLSISGIRKGTHFIL